MSISIPVLVISGLMVFGLILLFSVMAKLYRKAGRRCTASIAA